MKDMLVGRIEFGPVRGGHTVPAGERPAPPTTGSGVESMRQVDEAHEFVAWRHADKTNVDSVRERYDVDVLIHGERFELKAMTEFAYRSLRVAVREYGDPQMTVEATRCNIAKPSPVPAMYGGMTEE
jgi:hypothetical protein